MTDTNPRTQQQKTTVTITHLCGHQVSYDPPHRDPDKVAQYIDLRKHKPCLTCLKLPVTHTCGANEKHFFIGSESQIEWATRIRKRRIKDIGVFQKLFHKKEVAALLNKVHTAYWIETRHYDTNQLLQDPDKAWNDIISGNAAKHGGQD